MIKLLILCAVFLGLYFGFNSIGEYDSKLLINSMNYEVETTLFASIFIFFIFLIVSVLIIKLLFSIFNFPSFLRNRWKKYKLVNANQNLFYAFSEMIMGNRQKSISIVNKLISDISHKKKDMATLILAENEKSQDKKIEYLEQLINKKNYSIYASKRLAEIFYQNKDYKKSEEYAIKAFNEDDTDSELMLILIRLYSSLEIWPRLVFIVSKLQRANNKLLESHAHEISKFYLEAAKSYLKLEDDEEAKSYLESALQLRPDYLEAINILVEIETSSNHRAYLVDILKLALIAKPSFEIAKMYLDNSDQDAKKSYKALSKTIDSKKYPGLFLAIASYLGLNDEVDDIKQKLSS